ncbi:FUSC family protein [Phycicoccus flavus]|uniref:FUSC family protein n=1 Tax=Phycicoccus flavus TaxID=2502783 RepID=A0A8T6R488_9MICO|nr:FUSC family protein [Phycicoccus flavus]NHA69289.1 FUSC family protein [Phycicoccus flavus]
MHRGLLALRDRLAASDPGFGRLRTGVSVLVGVGSTVAVLQLVARLVGVTGQAAFAMTLFGAVVAMLASNALSGMLRREKLPAAAGFPVAVAVGLVLAVLTDTHRLLQVLAFAVVLFAAVYVRRFGGAWFFYGFMAWMGFFFATFLRAQWSLVPELLLAAVVASGWVLLLGVTVLHTNPRRILHSTLRAFFSRGRSVAREAGDLLAVAPGNVRGRARALRALDARRAGLGEAALLADAWSADRSAVPEGWSPSALRRRLIEAQAAIERVAAAATRLQQESEPVLREVARSAAVHLAGRRDVAALVDCGVLRRHADEVERAGGEGWWSARSLAYGIEEFLRFDAAATEPPEVDPGEEAFEAASDLAFGGLPGSPAVARDVAASGASWNPMTRLTMTTRQAVQVAVAGVVAIGLGTLLSPTRFYWAVITAFVMFTGTSTRFETVDKGVARIAGTVAGLVGAVVLARLTAGHDLLVLAIILLALFGAFYVAKVSQAAMTFCITVLLGELYTLIGTYSVGLLELRLGETAIGAAAGIVVALLFAPLSTRATVRSARDAMLSSMVALLEGVATRAEGGPVPDLDARVRRLDDDARRLALVARPLTRQVGWGGAGPRTARRLRLYIASVSQCRALVVALQRRPAVAPDAVAAAARSIVRALRAIAELPPGSVVPDADEPLADADHLLFRDPAASDEDPAVRHLHHLAATLLQVVRTTSGGTPGPRVTT